MVLILSLKLHIKIHWLGFKKVFKIKNIPGEDLPFVTLENVTVFHFADMIIFPIILQWIK